MCGVCGIFGPENSATIDKIMTFKLQHRGPESAGVAVLNYKGIGVLKGEGLVDQVLPETLPDFLNGFAAIGHTRYATQGGSGIDNVQPFSFNSIGVNQSRGDSLAISYNGNLANYEILRRDLESMGHSFRTSVDTEIILKFLESSAGSLEDRIRLFASKAVGSYTLLILDSESKSLVAVRDPKGFMPLAMAKLDDAILFASETRAFDVVNAKYEREVNPGEIITVNSSGIYSSSLSVDSHSFCSFQFVYFGMPDSNIFGLSAAIVKKKLGVNLANEDYELINEAHSSGNFIVVPVPDSSNFGALGYSQASGIPLEFGLVRDHYIGRTFLNPNEYDRALGARMKLNPIKEIISGKDVILVDDSIVRGTTMKMTVQRVFDAGARSVHVRIFSPPYTDPCFYGIDTPFKEDLIASKLSIPNVASFIGATSLRYLSLEGLLSAMKGDDYCTACFTGVYPTPIYDHASLIPLVNQ